MTITDEQIEQLRVESGEHGDLVQVAYCRIALNEDVEDLQPVQAEELARHLTQAGRPVPSPAEARRVCADVIAKAQAASSRSAG